MTAGPGPSLAGLYGAGQRRPLYSRFPSLYFGTPPWLRSLGRRWAAFRRGGSDELVELYLSHLESAAPGPGGPVPLLLTHDVDTGQGLAALPRLLEIEEKHGFRSLTLLVTHRYPWERDPLEELRARGHRFGVHDTLHDNRIAYMPSHQVRLRLQQAQSALGALDSGAFRAPAFLRSRSLYEGIADAVTVDLSSNDWALAWPRPGDGIGSPYPARLGKLLCVPTTLPRDGEMLALGLSPARMLELWKAKSTQLHRVGAPVVLLNHPDPGFSDTDGMLGAYDAFLAWAEGSGLFRADAPEECIGRLHGAQWPKLD